MARGRPEPGRPVLSFTLLLAAMAAVHGTWNLLSLVAVPLLLGTSVDSTIPSSSRCAGTAKCAGGVAHDRSGPVVVCRGQHRGIPVPSRGAAISGSRAWTSYCIAVGRLRFHRLCGFAPRVVACGRRRSRWGSDGTDALVCMDPPLEVWGWIARMLPDVVAALLAPLGCRLVPVHPARALRRGDFNLRPVAGTLRESRSAWRRTTSAVRVELVDLWRQGGRRVHGRSIRPGTGWNSFSAARSGARRAARDAAPGKWELGTVLLKREESGRSC